MNLLPITDEHGQPLETPATPRSSAEPQGMQERVYHQRPPHRRHRSYSGDDLHLQSLDHEDEEPTPPPARDEVLDSGGGGSVAQEAADALRAAEEAAARASAQPEEVFEANDFSYENLLRLDYNRNRRGEGLELTKLLRLKTVVCRTGGSCSICLEDFDDGDRALLLPCKHRFHAQCVGHWFHEHRECPNCRHEVK